jgi:glycosyltransferase involved in cell wall biosynthesis
VIGTNLNHHNVRPSSSLVNPGEQGILPREKRILCVIRWPVGGIRSYILYNYPKLIEGGYRFTFVGPSNEDFRSLALELRSWEEVEFIEAPLSGPKCRLWGVVRRQLRGGRFSILHSHGFTAATQAVLANLGIGVPHVFTSHDVFRPGQFPGFRGQVKLWLINQIVSRIDTFIAVSEDARTNYLGHLTGLARRPEKVITISNGIETERFLNPRTDCFPRLRARLGVEGGTFLIGFLGRFMEEKGFLILVDAVSRMIADPPPVDFRIVAVGSGDFEREYRQEVARRNLSDLFQFHEFVPDIAPLLMEIDLVVVPSISETCPLLPMEAMAAGVPVLGSDCIGLREVLLMTPSVTVPAGDAQALCDALRAAIQSPWSETARAYAPEARGRFSVLRSAAALGAVFDELTQTSSRDRISDCEHINNRC